MEKSQPGFMNIKIKNIASPINLLNAKIVLT